MKYLYKCPFEHITEVEFKIGQNPDEVPCTLNYDDLHPDGNYCGLPAKRYINWIPPVRYNGTGFASTEIPRRSGLEDIKI